MSNLANFYKIIQESEYKSKKTTKESIRLDDLPFIVFEVDVNSKSH